MFVEQKGVGQIYHTENNKSCWDYLGDFKKIYADNTKNYGKDRGNIVNP